MIDIVRPSDQVERSLALDTSRSYIVQAPAGSGKTELLTMRFLQLLSEVDSPAEILAITFTRSATAEMRRRILESLELATQSPHDGEDLTVTIARRALLHAQQQGWDLLKNPQLLKIETIDSFSLAIANRKPILAGLGGRLHPTEFAEPLYSRAAKGTLQMLGGEDNELGDAIGSLLSLRDCGVLDCQHLIASMLASRDRWQHAFVLTRNVDWEQVRAELERPFVRAIRSTLKKLAEMLARSGVSGDELMTLASFACANLSEPHTDTKQLNHLIKIMPLQQYATYPPADEDHLCAWKALLPFLLSQDKTWRRRVSKDHGFPPLSRQQKQELAALISRLEQVDGLLATLCDIKRLPPPRYSDQQWSLLRKLFLTLRHANGQLEVIFAEKNVVDFVQLAIVAERILEHHDEVLGSIPTELALAKSEQLKHVLVDEFQDTSRRQHSLLRILTAGWSPLEGRTCFLVGDPMQSIYLFRQAEVELFQNAGRYGLSPDLPLQLLHLTTNFRSNRGIVEPLNDLLSPIFQRRERIESAPVQFFPSAAYDRDFYPNNVNIVTDLIPPTSASSDREKAEARRREARSVVNIVESHSDRLAKARRESKSYRVAILARARTHLLLIADMLREANISFRAVEIESLDERQEIIDLTALLRALVHPMDRVAWLSILRAPWCGLSLADLHQLCGADHPDFTTVPVIDLLRARIPLLSEEGQRRARRAHLILEKGMRQRLHSSASQPLAPWLERIWHSLGGPDCVDATACENVQVFFSMLEELDEQGIAYLGNELDDRLKRLFAQPDPTASEQHGVQLMTIHKAKGLGFEVVIVPGLDRPGKMDEARLLTWLERSIPQPGIDDDPSGSEILIAPIGGKGAEKDTLNSWVKDQEKMRLVEEQKRLFYVACTRARFELHLLGSASISVESRGQNQPLTYSLKDPTSGSLLETAWPGIQSAFVDALDRWKQNNIAKDTSNALLFFPDPEPAEIQETFSFAASAEKTLRRLPDTHVARALRPSVTVPDTIIPFAKTEEWLSRSSGSLSARAFGIAVHTLLDKTAHLLAPDPDANAALQAVLRWSLAAEQILRQQGVSNSEARTLAAVVITTVRRVLEDKNGRWILSPHPEAQSEAAWSGLWNGSLRNVRADRIFLAGNACEDSSLSTYWIVDFKTASHGSAGLDEFLCREKENYEAQLEAYAEVLRMLKGSQISIKLGLYYTALRRLIEWSA